ncbi:MAG: metallophosphoesterase [Chitinophagales bacterium]
MNNKEIYIISDLHIGGAAPINDEIRGFQIATHTKELAIFIHKIAIRNDAEIELIINGDMVDFLAEKKSTATPQTPLQFAFDDFTYDANEAIKKLKKIVEREAHVFSALKKLLANGHALTLLLGNHDVELALPKVRKYLENVLEAKGKKYQFLHDGEAYIVGNGKVLIEHGNRYDEWNDVDYDDLLKLRTLQSLNQKLNLNEAQKIFGSPRGSKFVQQIMNPIKDRYRFIDLIKPENETLIPLMLALEPNLRNQILKLAKIYATDKIQDFWEREDSVSTRSLSPASMPPKTREEQEMEAILSEILPTNMSANEFMDALETNENRDDDTTLETFNERSISTSPALGLNWVSGVLDLLFRNRESDLKKRLPALLQSLRILQTDKSFELDSENLTDYLDAASRLQKNGFQYIIFGHTHFARQVFLGANSYYYNTGTWADLMQFPQDILYAANETEALERLETFLKEIIGTELNKHILFRPTYVHIYLNENEGVDSIDLCEFQH